jgi:(p)ppGpp synthase/HD superfamily hydrolase
VKLNQSPGRRGYEGFQGVTMLRECLNCGFPNDTSTVILRNPMRLSELFDAALVYAAVVHREQLRKGSNIPYIAHLLSVSSRVLVAGGSEIQAIAGLLHDAAEDQGGKARLDDIHSKFGSAVAQIVADCTDSWVEPKPPWRPRKEAYLESLSPKPVDSLMVSLADKVDNAHAILQDYRALGDDLWSRFTGGREGTIWYYQSLSEAFAKILPCPLSNELSGIVFQLPHPNS